MQVSRDEYGETCDVKRFLHIGYPRNRCICRPGFVRKSFGEICIPKIQCLARAGLIRSVSQNAEQPKWIQPPQGYSCGSNEIFTRGHVPEQNCNTLPRVVSMLRTLKKP